jgi:hypothetical protein
MTAIITRLSRDMPEQLSRADLDAAADAYVDDLRVTHQNLLTRQAQWANRRAEQAAHRAGVDQPIMPQAPAKAETSLLWECLYGIGCIGLIVVFAVQYAATH